MFWVQWPGDVSQKPILKIFATGFRPVNFLKELLRHSYFPENFAKALSAPICKASLNG